MYATMFRSTEVLALGVDSRMVSLLLTESVDSCEQAEGAIYVGAKR
jgi:hypothetical protein